jgi:hypothetical protein
VAESASRSTARKAAATNSAIGGSDASEHSMANVGARGNERSETRKRVERETLSNGIVARNDADDAIDDLVGADDKGQESLADIEHVEKQVAIDITTIAKQLGNKQETRVDSDAVLLVLSEQRVRVARTLITHQSPSFDSTVFFDARKTANVATAVFQCRRCSTRRFVDVLDRTRRRPSTILLTVEMQQQTSNWMLTTKIY